MYLIKLRQISYTIEVSYKTMKITSAEPDMVK